MLFNFKEKRQVAWSEELDAWLTLHAPATALNYRAVWGRFVDWLGKGVLMTTEVDAIRYLAHLKDRPARSKKGKVSNYTVSQNGIIIRAHFERLRHAGFITTNPFQSPVELLAKAKGGQTHPTNAMTAQEVRRLFDSVPIAGKKNIRDRAFLALLFGGGLRISEALNLKISDLGKTQDQRTVLKLRNTKAQCDEWQELPEWATVIVDNYIQQRIYDRATSDSFLLINYRNHWSVPDERQLTPDCARKVWEGLLYRAGIVRGRYSMHSARATAITQLLDLGLSHREVKAFSRHSSIHMVEYYDKRRFSGADSPVLKLKY